MTKLFLLSLFLASVWANAQVVAHYTSTASNFNNLQLGHADNVPNCFAGSGQSSVSCWHYGGRNLETSTTVTYSAIAASSGIAATAGNGNYCLKYIYGRCAGIGYIYVFTGWTNAPGWRQYQSYSYSQQPSAITQLAFDNNGQIWALAGSCGSGKAIWQSYLNQGVEWWKIPNPSQCAISLSIANDGTMLIVDPSGTILQSTNTGQSWGNPISGPWKQVSASSSGLYVAVSSNNTVWAISAGAPMQQLGALQVISASADAMGTVWALGTNGALYRWYAENNAWSSAMMGGGFTVLANGGPMDIWALGSNSHSGMTTNYHTNLWTFPDLSLNVTPNLSGYSTCGAKGCGSAMVHPLIGFVFGLNNGMTQNTVYKQAPLVSPTTQINFSATFTMYDLFNCDDPSFPGACQIQEQDFMQCSPINDSQDCGNTVGPQCIAVWTAASAAINAGAPLVTYSEDYVAWGGAPPTIVVSQPLPPNGWYSVASCQTPVDRCTGGSVAVCLVDSLNISVKVTPTTQAVNDSYAKSICENGSAGGTAFAVLSTYVQGYSAATCKQVAVDVLVEPKPCF